MIVPMTVELLKNEPQETKDSLSGNELEQPNQNRTTPQHFFRWITNNQRCREYTWWRNFKIAEETTP